jgi:hypothetical protein
MITSQRAAALAQLGSRFPLLGQVTADDLVEIVRLELGHPEILDGFRPYDGHFSHAVAVEPILHVLSENTPHAGSQSLIRGLLLGAMNSVKLPRAGLPEVEDFAEMLPTGLKDRVLRAGAEGRVAARLESLIVFGRDETIAHFQTRASPDRSFEAHPHRVSLGIVFDDCGRFLAVCGRDSLRPEGCLSLTISTWPATQ